MCVCVGLWLRDSLTDMLFGCVVVLSNVTLDNVFDSHDKDKMRWLMKNMLKYRMCCFK